MASCTGHPPGFLELCTKNDIILDLLGFLDVRMWSPVCVASKRTKRLILNEHTGQCCGTALHFQEIDEGFLWLPPSLLARVDFPNLRFVVFDDVHAKYSQGEQVLLQIVFVLRSGRERLESVRFLGDWFCFDEVSFGVKSQVAAAVNVLSALRVLVVPSQLVEQKMTIQDEVESWAMPRANRGRILETLVIDSYTPAFLSTGMTFLGRTLLKYQGIKELGIGKYAAPHEQKFQASEHPVLVKFLQQALALAPHSIRLRIHEDSCVVIFPDEIVKSLDKIQRVIIDGLVVSQCDLSYFNDHIARQFPTASKLVLDNCTFELNPFKFISFCDTLAKHFKSVRFRQSCKLSSENAAAALALLHTKLLMNDASESERGCFQKFLMRIIEDRCKHG
eukprot:gnl/MRDRNA2_/MRDRNA2_233690_c0_seq1.p1 gnl/MRDRNA2_/MRDRNA2_233690_c0~~gnl/MRDRNA2_/MRDRNA2_233690_c0_seq1.p1  ORF type:complete len:391 (+),score=35.34 gnl/MRDRNA2_/MRDRNA2_233690_c0_seq1:58-1230(+)